MRTNYPRHLRGFDYIGFHRYFLTFCTHGRRPLFDRSATVALVIQQFLRAAADEDFALVAYCFMPDHVHLVAEGLREDSNLLRFTKQARQLAGFHFKQAAGAPLWQRYCYERVLRNDEATWAVVRYVLENPVRAGLVASVDEYPHIGSSLCGRKELIEYAYADGRPADGGRDGFRST